MLIVLLFKTKPSLFSSLAKQVSFYVGGRVVAVFSVRVWKRSRRLLCGCPEPRTSFFAAEDLLQVLQRTERLLHVASVCDICLDHYVH